MTAKHLVTVLSNGLGERYLQCHCCFASSPSFNESDDLKLLALARAAGWTAIRIEDDGHMLNLDGGRFRMFCQKPKCQRQAGD
ncbi:hypothetical protein VT84_13545 [Gemmata sp. SH-PL17]|nr:hypothetical protein VT84_13545 [Gemmata sp. SH-PL17]